MEAGLLRFPIDIYQPIIKKNEYGEDYCEYEKKYSTRAKIDYTSGNRTNDNQEMIIDYFVAFTVRKYVPVGDNDRIYLIRNKKLYKYRILSIEPSESKQNLTIRTELINE